MFKNKCLNCGYDLGIFSDELGSEYNSKFCNEQCALDYYEEQEFKADDEEYENELKDLVFKRK